MGKLTIIIPRSYWGLESFEIWQAGVRFYDESQLDAIKKALLEYNQNNDTKAASGASLAYSSGLVCSVTERYCLF